jgi:thymidine kinase
VGIHTVVGIDEAHFFGAALIAPVMALVNSGVRVIVCGVERDHKGRPFDPFPTLLCEADHVLKMSGPCAVCGRPAIHSQRMTSSDAPIVVGGAEMYQARCRACFKPL